MPLATSGLLLIIGGAIVTLMGVVHAVLTAIDLARPTYFTAKDNSLRLVMKTARVPFTRGRASMWDAAFGFHLSHSLGMLVFGAAVIWLGLSLDRLAVPRGVLMIPVGIALIYTLLAVRFWFYAPAIGYGIAALCFAAAWLSY